MKVLIIDNGFKAYKPFLIKSFEKDINIELKVIYNFESLKKFSLIERIFYRLRFPLDNSNFNSRILSISNKFKPHLILIIKGNYVLTRTMAKLKSNSNAKIVSWSADNMIKKHNTSFYFDKSISKYDIHFTTKSTAVETLKNIGARKVVFLNKAFSKYDHFPADYDINYDFDVNECNDIEETLKNDCKISNKLHKIDIKTILIKKINIFIDFFGFCFKFYLFKQRRRKVS